MMVELDRDSIAEIVQETVTRFTSRFIGPTLLKTLFILLVVCITRIYLADRFEIENKMWRLFISWLKDGTIKTLYRRFVRSEPYRPFDHLPDELISEILCLSVYVRDGMGHLSRSSDFKFPATTLRVSKRFREITFNSPGVWSIIYIGHHSHIGHLALRLRYSKAASLDVVVRQTETGGSSTITRLRATLRRLLVPHLHRIHTIQCSLEVAHALFGLDAGGEGIPKSLKVIRFSCAGKLQDTWGYALNLVGLASAVTISGSLPEARDLVGVGTLNVPCIGLAKLCLWKIVFHYQDYLLLLQQQPYLEELALSHCTIWAEGMTVPTTPLTLPHLRRYQVVESTYGTLHLLLGAFLAPKLEQIEASDFRGSAPAGLVLQDVSTLAFPSLKRLRISITRQTHYMLKPLLPLVTELHLSGCPRELGLFDSRVRALTKVVELCTNSGTIIFEDLPPSQLCSILELHGSRNLRHIGVSMQQWGLASYRSHEEFKRLKEDQTWLLELYDTWFVADLSSLSEVRYSSWENLQKAHDVRAEMQGIYATRQISKDRTEGKVGPMDWQHVYNPSRDWAS